jgi:predicted enzyme related to lactoylglutathione lyase
LPIGSGIQSDTFPDKYSATQLGPMETLESLVKRVWTVSIPVSNFEKSIAFYRDQLGLKVQLDGRMFNWMELGPDEPLCKIALYEWKEGIPGKYPVHTGITLDTSDIQELYKRLKASGTKFPNPPKQQEWGGWSADFLDPDGNTLNVVQDPNHYKFPK